MNKSILIILTVIILSTSSFLLFTIEYTKENKTPLAIKESKVMIPEGSYHMDNNLTFFLFFLSWHPTTCSIVCSLFSTNGTNFHSFFIDFIIMKNITPTKKFEESF